MELAGSEQGSGWLRRMLQKEIDEKAQYNGGGARMDGGELGLGWLLGQMEVGDVAGMGRELEGRPRRRRRSSTDPRRDPKSLCTGNRTRRRRMGRSTGEAGAGRVDLTQEWRTGRSGEPEGMAEEGLWSARV